MLLGKQLKAQDAHLSQFWAAPVLLNPSYTGNQDQGDIRVTGQVRNQWNSVTNKLTTTTLSVDRPLPNKWGAGVYLINYDAAKAFNVFNFVLSGSYDLASRHQKKHKINMGLQLGVINKSTSNDKLVFDNQYVDGTFDTDIPTGENLPRMTRWMPEVNWGISYFNIEHNKKFRPYAGVSIFHLTHPKESFIDDNRSRLPLRYVANIGSRIHSSDELILDTRILFMRQRNAMEINGGMDAEYILQPNVVAVTGGLYYRYNDAVIPMIGLDYKGILFRMTYDINISTLKAYSKGRGGVEFSLTFQGGRQHHAFHGSGK